MRLDSPVSKNIVVLGAGSWGGTLAQYLSELGHSVTVWHRNRNELLTMSEKGIHPFIPEIRFPPSVTFVPELKDLDSGDIVIIGVPSHGVREVVEKQKIITPGTLVLNLAKGIENETLLRMSEVISDAGQIDSGRIATLSGPSHAEEVARRVPTVVVVAGKDSHTIETIQDAISSEALRVYANTDIVGVELAGSVKNVIAIAAGVCDGIGFGDNTKAALIIRGAVEISRLGVAMGARPETLAGLSGIGDLIVTCFSRHSRNRYVGEEIGKGRGLQEILKDMHMVAEGIQTTRAVPALAERHGVEMPICSAVHRVLFENEDPMKAVRELMTRELGYEHQ
ncbi:MAG: NAD(P)H-dependent glycerol-3-phosphate dehydrogenase [Fidelibacterota bacterium]